MSSGYNTDGLYTFPETESPIYNCLDSIEGVIAFDVRDWSEDRRSAWIYGVVFGWDDSSVADLKTKYKWDNSDIQRLNQLHNQWVTLKKFITDGKMDTICTE